MLIVSANSQAKEAFERYHPKWGISLLSSGERPAIFDKLDDDHHLDLYVEHDCCPIQMAAIAARRVRSILDFATPKALEEGLLICCERGVTRSITAAYLVLCKCRDDLSEAEILSLIRRKAPYADPCPMLISKADDLLARDGRLLDAIDDLPPPSPVISAPLLVL